MFSKDDLKKAIKIIEPILNQLSKDEIENQPLEGLLYQPLEDELKDLRLAEESFMAIMALLGITYNLPWSINKWKVNNKIRFVVFIGKTNMTPNSNFGNKGLDLDDADIVRALVIQECSKEPYIQLLLIHRALDLSKFKGATAW